MTGMTAENSEKINPAITLGRGRGRGRPRKAPSTRLAEPPKKTLQPENLSPQNPATDKRTWGAKRRASPRHEHTCRRILRIGQMAWEGRSAGEIADEVGVSVAHVYHLCSFYRIKLSTKTRAEYAFRATVQIKSLLELEKIAAKREEDITDLTAKLLDALANEPTLVANILDDAA